jgi:hypothetical protein
MCQSHVATKISTNKLLCRQFGSSNFNMMDAASFGTYPSNDIECTCPLSKNQVYSLLTSLTRLKTCLTADSLPCVWTNTIDETLNNDHSYQAGRLTALRAALLNVYSAAVIRENAVEGDARRRSQATSKTNLGMPSSTSGRTSGGVRRTGYACLVAAL